MKGEKYLFVVSGPSGTGKDTVVAKLLGSHPEIEKTVSDHHPHHARRGSERLKTTIFLTKEQFETALAEGNIVEHTCYCENYYGTLRSEVERHMEQQVPVILVIEVEGAGNIKRMYPGSTTIFVMPPDMKELERRLRYRGTEAEEVIQKRLRRAETEIARSADYDEHVVNDVVDTCAEEIYSIIQKRIAEPDAE